ncbi:YceI family protein [Tolypothrix campylonemoides VB511288]|nr:YceI family protein [Tolypothrix campylonemoides VB511288]
MRPASVLPLLLLAASAAAFAEPRAYALDPVHTRVLLAIDHAGFSKALGTVSGSTGTVWFADADGGIDWTTARLDVRVPVAALDFGDAKWNAAVQGRGLLDGERHPEARFVSDAITARDARSAQVCGALTLRGVTRPLCMDVTVNAIARYPLPPFRRTAGFSATATLSRAAFGADAWKSLIGDTVELRIEAEATRDRDADDAASAAPASTNEPKDPEPRP